MPSKRTPIYKSCENCGTLFRTKPSHAARRRFCSRTCKGMPFITITCQHCGTEFRKHATKQWRETKYCSRECVYAARAALPEAERIALLAPMHDAIKGRERTHDDLCRRAQGKQRSARLSDDEAVILAAFNGAGLHPVPQFAVDRFNIDFAFPDARLAVEYHGGNWHHSEKKRQGDKVKADYLAISGWTLVVLSRLFKPGSNAGNVSMTPDEMIAVVGDALRLLRAA